jgi:TPR repeat protein
MSVELRLFNRLTLSGVTIAVLLSASSAFAGASDDCEAAYEQRDYAEALLLCRSAAEEGDAVAQAYLGLMYAKGQGVPHDDGEAVKWYRKAADQGHAGAQNNLGGMYEQGRGVTQDYAEALKWYRKAAEQGDAVAQTNLGHMYDDGRGVMRDYVLAHMWFNLAAAQGFKDAFSARDKLAAKMTPAQIAEAQRLAREWKPTR